MQDFTQIYFWYISVQVVYNLHSILSASVTVCTCLLLRVTQSDRYGNLFSKMIMLSLLISSSGCLYIPIGMCHHFYMFYMLSVKWFAIWAGYTSKVFHFHLLNPYCTFSTVGFFYIILYLDNILVLTCSQHVRKRARSFYDPYWFIKGYTLVFPGLDLALLSAFVF